jgi:hypothetical protein
MAGTVIRKHYSQEQKVYALKQVEAESQVVEVCRQLGGECGDDFIN